MGKEDVEAWSKSDGAALAAPLTGHSLLVTSWPIVSGIEAIKECYQDILKNLEKQSIHAINGSKPVEVHAIHDNTAWAVGQWVQTSLGPIHPRG
jgi:hypothetical protein